MSSKGKNFSMANVDGKRKANDLYETPYSMTQQLLDNEKFDGVVLEPACGNGAILRILERNNYKCVGYDLEKDFLTETEKYDNIITNPPYSIANKFIIHAKQIARKKIAMLLPLNYLQGKERYEKIYLDKEFPLSHVCVFNRYGLLGGPLNEDGTYGSGMLVYAWYIWNRDYQGEPVLRWIDNGPYVSRKNKEKKEYIRD